MAHPDKNIDFEIIKGFMEQCDAYYFIAVKENSHISSIGGNMIKEKRNIGENIDGLHKLSQGMIGSINEAINKKTGNGLVLLTVINAALRYFPKLR